MYLTLADAKAHLGLTGTVDDGYLDALIAAATDLIDAQCGRHFEPRAAEHHYTARSLRGDILVLDDDLVDVVDIDELVNGDGTPIAASALLALPHNTAPAWGLLLRNGGRWIASDDQPIYLNALWSYSAQPPAAIVQACKELVADLYHAEDRQTTGLGKGADAYSLTRELPPRVLVMLRPYVKRSL